MGNTKEGPRQIEQPGDNIVARIVRVTPESLRRQPRVDQLLKEPEVKKPAVAPDKSLEVTVWDKGF